MSERPSRSIVSAILVAAAIALVVSVLRFHGEQNRWSPVLFDTEPGGGWSPLSITWLVLVFGFWFGRSMALNGNRPAGIGRALKLHLVGAVLLLALVAGTFAVVTDWRTRSVVVNAGAAACGLLAFAGWRRAYLANLGAAVLARVPVMVIQYLAIEGAMDVHFAKGPTGCPPADVMVVSMTAQAVMWPLGYSVLVGGFFAVLGAATVRGTRGWQRPQQYAGVGHRPLRDG